jgi:hypothetical protein
MNEPANDSTAQNAAFEGDAWSVRLTGYAAPERAAPGRHLPVVLHWEAGAPSPPGTDYTVFLHLRDAFGSTVANADATPTWFTPEPTSLWAGEGAPVLDAHELILPAELAAGEYGLVTGWYDWRTGQRMSLRDGAGNVLGDEIVLGSVTLDPGTAPVPDLCCLYSAECCASQQ